MNDQGFTLIETLVALLIFSIALVALMTIVSKGVQSARGASLLISGEYLAQEGIELVRNQRDSNFLSSAPNWTDGLTDCFPAGSIVGCQAEAASQPLLFVPCNGSCLRMFTDSSGIHQYNQNPPNEETPFIRTISMEQLATDEVRVTSRVEWEFGGITRFAEFSESLTNWQGAN